MKIGYKKKHLNVNLILGLVWLVWFFVGVFGKEKPNWTDYGWIVISIMYLGLYFYQKNYKYLTIENGIINVNGPFGKKLNLSEIKRIKKFAGDYILKTDKKELTINTQIIDPNSLAELNAEFEKLNIEWD
ncbi:hypothetical protein MC378_14685 [Polaribacter sp. MSW13]|uniref:PH domain-containing protein n=1 Tax=Polaribacter marinus TaxID=2916838 RepID=A0A9X1VRB1_9FLAO|nr:hypothetical protein [Polaribacter marinus]MCI2230423.1 hypothetical protein [Polaribacter marinus]